MIDPDDCHIYSPEASDGRNHAMFWYGLIVGIAITLIAGYGVLSLLSGSQW